MGTSDKHRDRPTVTEYAPSANIDSMLQSVV